MLGDAPPYGGDYVDPESPRPDGFFSGHQGGRLERRPSNASQPRRSIEQLHPAGFGGGYAPPPPPAPTMGLPGGFGMGGVGGFGAGRMGSMIPGPGEPSGGRRDPFAPAEVQATERSAMPAIPQPVFPSMGQPVVTKPPLDTRSLVTRTSSMHSDGWGGRRSTDGYEHAAADPSPVENLEYSPGMQSEGWSQPTLPHDQPSGPAPGVQNDPSASEPLVHAQESGEYLPKALYPSYRHGAVVPTQENEVGTYDHRRTGGYEDHRHAEYPRYPEHPEHRGYVGQSQHPQPSTMRKPPPAIAKESPLKALYAKGAENYDGNRRKISLTAVMDSVATETTTLGAQPNCESRPPVDRHHESQDQLMDQYSDYPSEYPQSSEYQSEYPSEYQSAAPAYATEHYGAAPDDQAYGGASEHGQEHPSGYKVGAMTYPPSNGANEIPENNNPSQFYGMPGQGSNQGSSQSFNTDDALLAQQRPTHHQQWNESEERSSRDQFQEVPSSAPAVGAGNPGLERAFRPINPGSPGGKIDASPPTFDQAKPFIPGQTRDAVGQQPMQPQGAEALVSSVKGSGAIKVNKRRKRMFLFRPFSIFYQMIFAVCLVLNPAWTISKVAFGGALVQAGVAAYSGMNTAAFRSMLAKQYPAHHRVHEHNDTISSTFDLVSTASENAWKTTAAKLPCASDSVACIWARKVLHAGLTAGLVSQRSVLVGYKHVPSIIGHAGVIASDVKAFLVNSDTWRLDGLRTNVLGVGKSAVDYTTCFAKNAIHSSNILDLTTKAIECGTMTFEDMLLKGNNMDAIFQGDGDSQELEPDVDLDDEFDDYEDPYAMQDKNATDPIEPVKEAVIDDQMKDSNEQVMVEKGAMEREPDAEDGVIDHQFVGADQEAYLEDPTKHIDASVPEEPAELDEPNFEAGEESDFDTDELTGGEEMPGPIAPDEIPPMSDDMPETVAIEDMPEPIVVDPVPDSKLEPESTLDGIPPVVAGEDDEDQAAPEDPIPYSEDYPSLEATPEEIQARAQRILNHEKKLADRKKKKPTGMSDNLRSALSDTTVIDAPHAHVDSAHVDSAHVDSAHVDSAHVDSAHVDSTSIEPLAHDEMPILTPAAPPVPSTPSPPLFETLVDIIQANMTHILTAIISAMAASSVFIIQGLRSSHAGFNLPALSGFFNGLAETPRISRKSRRSRIRDDKEEDHTTAHKSATSRGRRTGRSTWDDEDDAPTTTRTARSKTPRGKGRKVATTSGKKAAEAALSTATRRSSRRSSSRK